MYLAYLDDSDTKKRPSKWQVMASVIIKDSQFRELEIVMSTLAEVLLPSDKLETFTEFHACELYGGHGVFEGIEQAVRFAAIEALLSHLERDGFPVIYGAVNLDRLREQVYASAEPLDIAFRICTRGVHKWIENNASSVLMGEVQRRGLIPPLTDVDKSRVIESILGEMMVLLIADDCDGKSKAILQRSFRKLRSRYRIGGESSDRLYHLHDDMYFGDSKSSVGIQLADLCSYFIARHLEGDTSIDGFFKRIEKNIVFSQIEPAEENSEAEANTVEIREQ